MVAPIRVAHVIGKMIGGGVEQVVMNYFRHIDRERVQFDFLVDADSTLVPTGEIEALGGRVIVVPPYQKLPSYERELECLFREERWPIVHSHVNALSVFPLGAAKRAGVPVRIAHSHSTAGKGEPLRGIMKSVLRNFSNVYPTHRFACGDLAGKWLFGDNAKFELVRNAIDLDRFAFDRTVRSRVRKELHIPNDTLVIGNVGRFMSQKNHTFLIEAFRIFHCEHPDSLLLLVGEGGLRPKVETAARDAGIESCVRFLGQRSDVADLYQAFDVFALPSLYEGLCVVGVEAQRSGLPCVFSDAITKEISLTGKVRFLPIDDPRVWANALMPSGASREVDTRSFEEYDIVTAAKKLEGRYINLAKEIGC